MIIVAQYKSLIKESQLLEEEFKKCQRRFFLDLGTRVPRSWIISSDERQKNKSITSTNESNAIKSMYRQACLQLHPDKGGEIHKFQQLQNGFQKQDFEKVFDIISDEYEITEEP